MKSPEERLAIRRMQIASSGVDAYIFTKRSKRDTRFEKRLEKIAKGDHRRWLEVARGQVPMLVWVADTNDYFITWAETYNLCAGISLKSNRRTRQ